MTPYQKGLSVMNYLQSLKLDMITIGEAIDDKNLEQSYKLLKENPQISKAEFLEKMKITEE